MLTIFDARQTCSDFLKVLQGKTSWFLTAGWLEMEMSPTVPLLRTALIKDALNIKKVRTDIRILLAFWESLKQKHSIEASWSIRTKPMQACWEQCKLHTESLCLCLESNPWAAVGGRANHRATVLLKLCEAVTLTLSEIFNTAFLWWQILDQIKTN